MIKTKNIVSLLLQFFTVLLIPIIVLSQLNVYKRTSYICAISGTRKTVVEEFFIRTTSVKISSLEEWIRKNYDPNFKNDFIYRDSKTVYVFKGTSRGLVEEAMQLHS